MIIASLKIAISHKKQQDALQTIRAILGWTCAQPGCISMTFNQDTFGQAGKTVSDILQKVLIHGDPKSA